MKNQGRLPGLPWAVWLVSALLLFVLAGCQAGKSGEGYGAFYTPADHVQELLDANKVKQASTVYAENAGFFTSADPDVAMVRDRLARALLQELRPQAEAALAGLREIQWPCKPSAWPAVEKALGEARLAISALKSHKILTLPEYRPGFVAELVQKANDLRMQITADASKMLDDYPVLASDRNFFEIYPAKVKPAKAFGNATAFWDQRLDGASTEQIKQAYEVYADDLPQPALEAMGLAYYRRTMQNERAGGAPSLAAIMAAVTATREAGLPLDSTPGTKVVFVNVTSYTLMRKGLLDFPVAFENDMPFESSRKDMRRLFASNATADADIYVLVDIAVTRSERDIYNKETMLSEFLAGARTMENREYIDARDRVRRLRQKFDQAGAQAVYAPTTINKLFGAITQSELEDELEQAEADLKNTPMYVEKEIYKDYPYRVFDMDVVKLATVNYYVVDRRSNRYFKDTFDARQQQSFSIPYNVHPKDPHQHEIMENRDVEEDVLQFEEDPVTVPLSAILEQFVNQPGKAKPLGSLASLSDQIFDARNRAVQEAKKSKVFTARPNQDDDRFRAVVYIEMPRSSGSGFYVRDDIVMTNYHVVKESDFVELRLYDGTETFGKVIAKDIQRDLALVKVQARRKPVQFYTGNTVPLGATVEIIGNPQGFKFSISRGIISAVRKHESLEGMKSKPVLFIQTDAAANPGNSGGPLFLGDAVIGVVDWGKTKSEGLNFCIHYSEVLRFMRKNDVQPVLAGQEGAHASN